MNVSRRQKHEEGEHEREKGIQMKARKIQIKTRIKENEKGIEKKGGK